MTNIKENFRFCFLFRSVWMGPKAVCSGDTHPMRSFPRHQAAGRMWEVWVRRLRHTEWWGWSRSRACAGGCGWWTWCRCTAPGSTRTAARYASPEPLQNTSPVTTTEKPTEKPSRLTALFIKPRDVLPVPIQGLWTFLRSFKMAPDEAGKPWSQWLHE